MRLVTRLCVSCLGLAFTVHAAAGGAAGPVPVELRLNEFMAGPARDWDGSGTFSSRDDEWVEVANAGSSPLDLSAYVLTDGDSIPRYAFTGTLAPTERLIVFGGQSTAWERAAGFPAFGLSLGNSGDAVLLWRVVGAETLLVDSYAYVGHEASSDRAVGRINDSGDWQLFDGLNPYSGATPPPGNRCNPTPAAPNLCGATTARPSSWGRLKSIYR